MDEGFGAVRLIEAAGGPGELDVQGGALAADVAQEMRIGVGE